MKSRVLVDFKATVLEFSRSPSAIFWTLAFPVILMLLFGAIYSGGGSGNFNLYVQDMDDSEWSRSFLENLTATGFVNVNMINTSLDAQQVITDNSLTNFLIIPAGFGANLSANESAVLEFRKDDSSQSALALYSIIEAVAQQMDPGLQNVSALISIDEKSLVFDDRFKFLDFFLPGVLALTIMNSTVNYMVFTIVEYRNRGIFRKMMTTPLKRPEWLASRILWQMVLGFISLLLILGIGVYLFDVNVTDDLNGVLMTIALILAGTALFTAMGMAVAGLIKDEQGAGALAGAITFPMMFLAGIFFPLEMMPEYLQTIAKVIPLTYLADGLRDSMIYGNMTGAWFNLMVVSGLAVVFAALGTVLTRWKQE